MKYPIGWITQEWQISNTPLPAIPIRGLLPKFHRKGLASLGTKTSLKKGDSLNTAQNAKITGQFLSRFRIRCTEVTLVAIEETSQT